MKCKAVSSFCLAAGLLVFAGPRFSHAQAISNSNSPDQASQLVPAQAVLATKLDAKTAPPGTQFQATLTQGVRLDDGTELPDGTRLIGTVASDSMAPQGKAALALRFTQADLKDGKTVPIKATIVDVASGRPYQEGFMAAGNTLIPWDGKSMKTDAVGVVSGVDLHSNIAANNSGVLVAPKKDDVKLGAGSQLSLAIGTQG